MEPPWWIPSRAVLSAQALCRSVRDGGEGHIGIPIAALPKVTAGVFARLRTGLRCDVVGAAQTVGVSSSLLWH